MVVALMWWEAYLVTATQNRPGDWYSNEPVLSLTRSSLTSFLPHPPTRSQLPIYHPTHHEYVCYCSCLNTCICAKWQPGALFHTQLHPYIFWIFFLHLECSAVSFGNVWPGIRFSFKIKDHKRPIFLSAFHISLVASSNDLFICKFQETHS